ncbi:alpha/beta hydrolase family protein [Polaribacter sp. P097]|uniref:alpha/beta hydrolase family protein n=1 Tax=Polaribacter sp. P097 TaxID=3117398 RepID=UPI002FE068F7
MKQFFKQPKFSSNLAIPKIVKIGIKFLNAISTRLTLFVISKLFATPIQFSRPERELGMLASSQKKKFYCKEIDKTIQIISYGFSDKKVLLAHGWSGRSTQLFMIANHLLEQGYMVISFDAPAHGSSSGNSTNLIEYIDCVKGIQKEFGPFDAAIGHSFGGMVLMNVQADCNAFKCLVTIGAADKVSDIFYNFIKNIGLNTSFANKFIALFEKKLGIRLDDNSTSITAKKVSIPSFIVHDVLDGDVAVSCAINIRQSLQKGALLITNGLGHTKILRNNNISLRIVKFIKEHT